jgi:hypothetical protein
MLRAPATTYTDRSGEFKTGRCGQHLAEIPDNLQQPIGRHDYPVNKAAKGLTRGLALRLILKRFGERHRLLSKHLCHVWVQGRQRRVCFR